MTTSANAGVASDSLPPFVEPLGGGWYQLPTGEKLHGRAALEARLAELRPPQPPPPPFTPPEPKDTVYIVGFAPSWKLTPWSDDAHFWGMNALHKIADDKPWTAWFQLHDIDKSHPEDKVEHMEWLAAQDFPVIMWEEEMAKNPLPNAVPYPRQPILDEFGNYFTNTVSWQVALAIKMGYKKIGIYGVDMAQDSEYASQRPSCEWMIGVAQGRGITVDIPGTSDLLKTPFLYGIEDGSLMRQRYQARLQELQERRAELERQRQMAHEAFLQVLGALEDTNYWMRVWTQQETKGEQT